MGEWLALHIGAYQQQQQQQPILIFSFFLIGPPLHYFRLFNSVLIQLTVNKFANVFFYRQAYNFWKNLIYQEMQILIWWQPWSRSKAFFNFTSNSNFSFFLLHSHQSASSVRAEKQGLGQSDQMLEKQPNFNLYKRPQQFLLKKVMFSK